MVFWLLFTPTGPIGALLAVTPNTEVTNVPNKFPDSLAAKVPMMNVT